MPVLKSHIYCCYCKERIHAPEDGNVVWHLWAKNPTYQYAWVHKVCTHALDQQARQENRGLLGTFEMSWFLTPKSPLMQQFKAQWKEKVIRCLSLAWPSRKTNSASKTDNSQSQRYGTCAKCQQKFGKDDRQTWSDAWVKRGGYGSPPPEAIIHVKCPKIPTQVDIDRRIPSGLSLRFQILKRDQYRCRLCGVAAADRPDVRLEIDHITPRSKGGTDDPMNLWTLCFPCNRGKGVNTL